MPEVEYAFLAVTRVTGPSLPFVHPHLALVVGLRMGSAERKREHELGFIVTAPDGAEVATAVGRVVSHGPGESSDVVLTIAIDLWNMTLKTAGEYAVRITINGSERKRLPLVVSVARELAAPEQQRYLA